MGSTQPPQILFRVSFHVRRCETSNIKTAWHGHRVWPRVHFYVLHKPSVREKYWDYSESHQGFSRRAGSVKWVLPSQEDAVSHQCISVYCPRVLNQIRGCSNYKVALGWSGASLAGFIFRGKACNLHSHLLMCNRYLILLVCFPEFLRDRKLLDFKHSGINDKRGGWIETVQKIQSFYYCGNVILNQTKWCHTQVNIACVYFTVTASSSFLIT